MISKTTKPDEYGWYYTFIKRNDGTLRIQQKNKINNRKRDIMIWGNDTLKTFYVVFSGVKEK